MKPRARDEHIKRLRDCYKDSSKDVNKFILNDICLTWGIDRKYAIKLLSDKKTPGKKAGRKASYDGRLVRHIFILWDSMERICAKRMKAAPPIWLPFYRDPEFDPDLKYQPVKMSASTIERVLNRGRKTLKGLSTTKSAKFFRYKIPIISENSKIVNVGHGCADMVAHCGEKISGEYVWSHLQNRVAFAEAHYWTFGNETEGRIPTMSRSDPLKFSVRTRLESREHIHYTWEDLAFNSKFGQFENLLQPD